LHDVEGGAAFGARFCEYQGSVGEVEGCESVAAGEPGCGWPPVQATGDHEMQDQPEAVVRAISDTDGDALADAAEFADGLAFGR
jgi:hypothetical protein